MRRAVVLLSGGLDSATVLALARRDGFAVHALTVRYGQRHEAELRAARRVAESLGAVEHREVGVELGSFGGSALTADIAVPKDRNDEDLLAIPVTYVPARNTVMLSLALAYAEVIGAHDIFVGVNAIDYSGYPDCRPEYIAAFQATARLATKFGVEGAPLTIHAPLQSMSKTEIVRIGLELGVDYGLTHSCYDPGPDGEACGRCDSCWIRQRAFASLGLRDPVAPETSGA